MGLGRVGAQKLAAIFGIKTDHSGIVKADGTTAAALKTDAELIIGQDLGEYIIESIDLTPNDDNSVTVKIVTTQYDSAVQTFKDKYFPRKKITSGGAKPEKKSVTGFTIGGSTSTGNKQSYLIVYGGGDGTDIIVNGYVIEWKNTSLGKSYKGGEWLTATFEGVSVAALQAITIPAAIQDSTIIGSVSSASPCLPLVHAADSYEGEWIVKKAA